jgi:hypothetical protein
MIYKIRRWNPSLKPRQTYRFGIGVLLSTPGFPLVVTRVHPGDRPLAVWDDHGPTSSKSWRVGVHWVSRHGVESSDWWKAKAISS